MKNPMTSAMPRWIVRPRWITPGAEEVEHDGVETAHPDKTYVFFAATFPNAHHVELIGTFTGWENHPILMDQGKNGTWFTMIPLGQGHHEYAYLVDNCWQVDPNSPQLANSFGSRVNECFI